VFVVFLAFLQYIKSFNLKAEEVLLAQGTLRPDLIESASEIASGHADVIKTHHNDTGMSLFYINICHAS